MNENNQNTTSTYIAGAILGLTTGLIGAYLFNKAAKENPKLQTSSVSAGDLIKLGMLLLGTVRQVAELASGKND